MKGKSKAKELYGIYNCTPELRDMIHSNLWSMKEEKKSNHANKYLITNYNN